MPGRIVSAVRSVLAAASLLCFAVAVLLGGGGGMGWTAVALLVVGTLALAGAVGPRAAIRLFAGDGRDSTEGDQRERDWWLAGFEPVVEDVWDDHADYALAGGLAIVGVGSLAALALVDDPPYRLAIVGLLTLNCSLIVLAGSALDG